MNTNLTWKYRNFIVYLYRYLLHEATSCELLKKYCRKVKMLLCSIISSLYLIKLKCDIHVCRIFYTKYNSKNTLLHYFVSLHRINIYVHAYVHRFLIFYEMFKYVINLYQQIQIWMKEAESTKGLLATKDIDSSQRTSDEQCILQ